jgi:hypothetical protein
MRTLRVKLNVPNVPSVPDETSDGDDAAHAAFETLSTVHADQAIFQINRTQYVDEDSWGFQIRYETSLHTQTAFIQSTSVPAIEDVMAQVAPESFEQRVRDGSP